MGICGEKSVILENISERMRFSGIISAKVDTKGRVFLPSAFRKQLPEEDMAFVIKRDVHQPCLVIYPRKVWDAEVDMLTSRLNRWNPREAMVLRQFLADAETFVLDNNGRLLLSRRLMQATDIDKEVMFLGMDDRIEIWNKNRGSKPFISDEDFGRIIEELMGRPDGNNAATDTAHISQ